MRHRINPPLAAVAADRGQELVLVAGEHGSSMLRMRQGAVICPSMAEPLVRGYGLAFLPLLQPAIKWRIAMFVRHSASLSPAVESFRDFTLDFSPSWAATGSDRRRTSERRKRV